MPADTRDYPTLFGHTITVFPQDHLSRHIRREGLFEKAQLLVLLDLLKKLEKPVVLDVGANIGNHALAFATVAGHVHAFEPNPPVFEVLQANISQNHLDNITAHRTALSDHSGTATLFIPGDNVGMSSLDRRADDTGSVDVPMQTGDAFVHDIGIPRIDFIKIDVEAHEYFVIKGLMQTLASQRPVLSLEWNDPQSLARFAGSEVMTFLLEAYDFHALGTTHDRTVWADHWFSWCRRKWHRLWPKTGVIHPFVASRYYDNLLLIPKGRSALLAGLPILG